MFYLYLIILSLTQFYFFNSLNKILYREEFISGDFIFSAICLIFAFLIVIGALHSKHINNDNLKKVGFSLMVIGALIVILSLFSFNSKTILTAIEFEIILTIIGYFIYYYQTVPEGVPDTEIDNDFKENNEYYFENNDSSFIEYQNDFEIDLGFSDNIYDDHISKPELEQIKEIIKKINDIEDIDINLLDAINKIENQIIQIDIANSEYKLETILDIKSYLQLLLDLIINNVNDDIIQLEESFNLISKNLENIYYNTRGAQVYRNQKELHELVEKLLNLQIQS